MADAVLIDDGRNRNSNQVGMPCCIRCLTRAVSLTTDQPLKPRQRVVQVRSSVEALLRLTIGY
jgi:hypothetical protein